MLDQLVLHDATRVRLHHFLAKPAHALLLTGPDGLGKKTVAEAVAAHLLGVGPAKLTSYPHYLHLSPTGSSISIDAIRELQRFFSLKTIGERAYRRAVIIESAHALTTEAQNAYLKLLEEPPADTIMILTAASPRALLPTILSRLQTVAVGTPSEEQLQPLFASSQKSVAEQRQAYFLSGGLPGLLHALLAGDEPHPLIASVTQAKALLQQQPFERLANVDTLSKNKEAALGVVAALERIAAAGLQAAGAQRDTGKIQRWHRIRTAALSAREALEKNANTKLTLDVLLLNLH
jgi:replication-associated recombination protein RarA